MPDDAPEKRGVDNENPFLPTHVGSVLKKVNGTLKEVKRVMASTKSKKPHPKNNIIFGSAFAVARVDEEKGRIVVRITSLIKP